MFRLVDELLRNAETQGVASAFSLLVWQRGRVVYEKAQGRLAQNDPRPATPDTFFDLASLTKPLSTAGLLAAFVQKGALDLDTPIGRHLPEWGEGDKAGVLLRHLLQHTSGLPAWHPFYEKIPGWPQNLDTAQAKAQVRHAIAQTPLLTPPGKVALYSDLDFITLGFLLEELAQEPLELQATRFFKRLDLSQELRFAPKTAAAVPEERVAATERHLLRGLLRGRVHDDNAWALGGAAGHAGLFGTARGVLGMLLEWRAAYHGEGRLFTRETVFPFLFPSPTPPRCGFALGFDRPSHRGSASGRHFSQHAIGHLGYTGTSAWLDLEREVCVVLLTNRVHPSGENTAIRGFRPALHDAVMEALDATAPGPYVPPPAPEEVKRVHLIGVAGTGMGSLAGMLKEAGYAVSGSDQAIYPPMSELLARLDIDLRQPFAAANLADAPDLTVVGNICTRDHLEVIELKRRGLAYDSFAGTLEKFFISGKTSLVVAGTHGKTTSSSLLAWQLQNAGRDPSFMIGGLVRNFERNYKLGQGPEIVIEGDEYDSAYFDKHAKFLHYRPHGTIVTSLEYDHADIYENVEEIEEAFARFVALIPEQGLLVAAWDHERVRKVAAKARCRLIRYGLHPEADWRPSDIHEGPEGTRFTILRKGHPFVELFLPMPGVYNALNATAVCALLHELLGLSPEVLRQGAARFLGVARRQEERGTVRGVRVIDDFAHHPTAIRETLAGLRNKYPQGRLLVAFDPRTNTTSRKVLQNELADAFAHADRLWLGTPSRLDFIAAEERLDINGLSSAINERGLPAVYEPDIEAMARALAQEARAGDTIAILSNGGFGGLIPKVLAALENR